METWVKEKQDKFISHEVQNKLLAIISKNIVSALQEERSPNLHT